MLRPCERNRARIPRTPRRKAARLKEDAPKPAGRPSSLVDTRVIYCGDNLEQLRKLPDACVDLIYIDPPFNSNRNYEVFWGETKEKRAFEDRHASTQAYIEFMRPRCVELARVLKKTGSFYYHCDWHASHYVKVMLEPNFTIVACRETIPGTRRHERAWEKCGDKEIHFQREGATAERQKDCASLRNWDCLFMKTLMRSVRNSRRELTIGIRNAKINPFEYRHHFNRQSHL